MKQIEIFWERYETLYEEVKNLMEEIEKAKKISSDEDFAEMVELSQTVEWAKDHFRNI